MYIVPPIGWLKFIFHRYIQYDHLELIFYIVFVINFICVHMSSCWMENLTGKGKFCGMLIKTTMDLIQIGFEENEHDWEKDEISRKYIGKWH